MHKAEHENIQRDYQGEKQPYQAGTVKQCGTYKDNEVLSKLLTL